ncbi:MAG: hypothetical protein HYU36_18635 [Planctomycetes bacterium]|nr:hypothetical protein [Planctomycetota bacterium]
MSNPGYSEVTTGAPEGRSGQKIPAGVAGVMDGCASIGDVGLPSWKLHRSEGRASGRERP